MKYVIYLISIIILLGINLGLFNNFQIRGQIPNLLFLLTLYFSLEKKDYDFFFISMACGLFLDFYSTGFFGAFTLAFLTVGLLIHIFSNNILVIEFNWKTLSSILIAGLFLFNLIIWFYGLVVFKLNWTGEYDSYKIFMGGFLPGLLYTWLLLYPMYIFSNFLRRGVESLETRSRGVIR